MTRIEITASAEKRILFTLGAALVYLLAKRIPVPFLDTGALRSAVDTYSVFSFGIVPYTSAMAAVLLLSGVVKPLKRLRDGSKKQKQKFDRIILYTSLVFAIIHGLAMGTFAVSYVSPSTHEPLVQIQGWVFKIVCTVTMSTGAMLCIWLSWLVTCYGIANGVVVLYAASQLSTLSSVVRKVYTQGLESTTTASQGFFSMIILLAVLGIAIVGVLAKTKVKTRLSRNRQKSLASIIQPPSIPIRMNMAGIRPYLLATSIAGLPNFIRVYWGWPNLFISPNLSYWILLASCAFALSYFFAAITFSPSNVISTLKQYGYETDANISHKESKRYLDQILTRTAFGGAVLLAFFSVAPHILHTIFRIHQDLCAYFNPSLMFFAAAAIEVKRRITAHQYMENQDEKQDGKGWIPVLEPESELEAELAKCVLKQADIDACAISTRPISLICTLGQWEACRPVVPALLVHPRLGQGRVMVMVRFSDRERAKVALAKTRKANLEMAKISLVETSPFGEKPQPIDHVQPVESGFLRSVEGLLKKMQDKISAPFTALEASSSQDVKSSPAPNWICPGCGRTMSGSDVFCKSCGKLKTIVSDFERVKNGQSDASKVDGTAQSLSEKVEATKRFREDLAKIRKKARKLDR